MTKEEILKMEAGPEIDALFHELVMNECSHPKEHMQYEREDWHCGLCGEWFDYNPEDCPEFIPKYSTNIFHATKGVERLTDDNHVLELMWIPRYLMDQKPFWNFMIAENKMKKTIAGCNFLGYECNDDEEQSKQVGAFADTMELAITRALILWAMEKEATDESKPRGD